jgi:hypothetical protein
MLGRKQAKLRRVSQQNMVLMSPKLSMIEPVLGNITVNKGMNKLTLRGKDKVNAQWQMYCLVHNIEKLRNSF